MKYKLILPVILLSGMIIFMTSSAMAKKNILQSNWTDKPVTIDGLTSDWSDVKNHEVKKYHIDYAFKNNIDSLYIIYTFKDPKFLSSISSSGMTVWLDNKGKKSKRYGIKFLKRQITPETFIKIIEKKQGSLTSKQKEEIKKRKFYTINQSGIVNKKNENPIPINLDAEQAPSFQVKSSSGTTVFEFKIPLQKIEGKISGIGTSPGGKIAVGFEWGGLTKELRKTYSRQRGYTSSDSSGQGVSENIPGGDEMEGASSFSDGSGGVRRIPGHRGPKKYSFWTTLQLATEK